MDSAADHPADTIVPPRDTMAARWRRARRWLASHSIRVRLYSVVALLFLSIMGLGAFGFARLSDVNHASEVIRNHWLRDTRILGDISNYMSDYRAAEATRLLSSTPAELAASEKEIAALDATVSGSQRAYEEITQDPSETMLYAGFAEQWAAYKTVAAQVIGLARAGRTSDAVGLYNTTSRRAFDLGAGASHRRVEHHRASSDRRSGGGADYRAGLAAGVGGKRSGMEARHG